MNALFNALLTHFISFEKCAHFNAPYFRQERAEQLWFKLNEKYQFKLVTCLIADYLNFAEKMHKQHYGTRTGRQRAAASPFELSLSGSSICMSTQAFHGDRPLDGNLRLVADMGKLTLLGMLPLIARTTTSFSLNLRYRLGLEEWFLVLTSIQAWVTQIMPPGWRWHAFFYTRQLQITATDSLVEHQSVSSACCLASCWLQLVWFCCFLAPTVLKTRFILCGTGWRVMFKLCFLAHQCLHGSAPPYLVHYFIPISSIVRPTHLRSAAAGMLFVPSSQTSTIGPWAFAISSFA